jgi:rhodanese-related sulfurtransferase
MKRINREGPVLLGKLVSRIADVRREGTVATICESGYRSALAASILARAGVDSVACVAGGMMEMRHLDC